MPNVLHRKVPKTLYSLLPTTLKQAAQTNYDNTKQKIDEIYGEVKKYDDTSTLYLAEVKQIQDKIDQKKASTKNFRGYIVLFKVLGADKENTEIKKDSLTVIISPNYRIIPYETI